MKIYELYIEQPDDTNLELMSEELLETLSMLFVEYPNTIATYTKPSNGRKLIHTRIRHEGLTVQILDEMLASFGLDWRVTYMREAYRVQIDTEVVEGMDIPVMGYNVLQDFDKASLLPFICAIIQDGEGVRLPTLSDTWLMPVYAGETPIWV